MPNYKNFDDPARLGYPLLQSDPSLELLKFHNVLKNSSTDLSWNKGQNYDGSQNKTISGAPCLSWTAGSYHSGEPLYPEYNPATNIFYYGPSSDLSGQVMTAATAIKKGWQQHTSNKWKPTTESNYCRNPEGVGGKSIWCFVDVSATRTDPKSWGPTNPYYRWDYCVPLESELTPAKKGTLIPGSLKAPKGIAQLKPVQATYKFQDKGTYLGLPIKAHGTLNLFGTICSDVSKHPDAIQVNWTNAQDQNGKAAPSFPKNGKCPMTTQSPKLTILGISSKFPIGYECGGKTKKYICDASFGSTQTFADCSKTCKPGLCPKGTYGSKTGKEPCTKCSPPCEKSDLKTITPCTSKSNVVCEKPHHKPKPHKPSGPILPPWVGYPCSLKEKYKQPRPPLSQCQAPTDKNNGNCVITDITGTHTITGGNPEHYMTIKWCPWEKTQGSKLQGKGVGEGKDMCDQGYPYFPLDYTYGPKNNQYDFNAAPCNRRECSEIEGAVPPACPSDAWCGIHNIGGKEVPDGNCYCKNDPSKPLSYDKKQGKFSTCSATPSPPPGSSSVNVSTTVSSKTTSKTKSSASSNASVKESFTLMNSQNITLENFLPLREGFKEGLSSSNKGSPPPPSKGSPPPPSKGSPPPPSKGSPPPPSKGSPPPPSKGSPPPPSKGSPPPPSKGSSAPSPGTIVAQEETNIETQAKTVYKELLGILPGPAGGGSGDFSQLMALFKELLNTLVKRKPTTIIQTCAATDNDRQRPGSRYDKVRHHYDQDLLPKQQGEWGDGSQQPTCQKGGPCGTHALTGQNGSFNN